MQSLPCKMTVEVELQHGWTHRHGHLQSQPKILIFGVKHARIYATAGTWSGSRGRSTGSCIFRATCARVDLQEQQQMFQGTKGLP